MQTILGSGGAIGVELAKVLPQYSSQIRLVSRHPEKVNETDELLSADLLVPDEMDKAVKGAEIVYLTVGFPYKTKVWEKNWPILTQNLIQSCQKYQAKLVFFDNIYMYDPAYLDGMTETTPLGPVSRKGKVREQVYREIMQAVENGNLTALIARSADFYGPGIKGTSVLTEAVINTLSQGKKANWLGKTDKVHSFTYTPDAAKATALLGNTDSAYNQVWHLPTAKNPLTGEEWVEKIAAALNQEPRFRAAPTWMVKTMGLFNPFMREMSEMMYQYETTIALFLTNSNRPSIYTQLFMKTAYERSWKGIMEVEVEVENKYSSESYP